MSDPDSPPENEPAPKWVRFTGIGFELAGITLLFLVLGYWIDAVWMPGKHFATAVGTLVGFSLAMTRFIIQVKKNQ